MNSDTPRTDAAAKEGAYMSDGDYSSTQGKQFVHVDFARLLERELNEAKEEIKWLKRELDAIEPSRVQWKAMAQELAAKLEAAAHTFRMRFASSVDTLKTTPTPYDESLSRFNAMNKCHHGIRDTATNLPYCRKCDEEGLK